MSALTISNFDCSTLPVDVAEEAKAAVKRIRERNQKYLIETGRDLLAMKERLGHGDFGPWLQSEFTMNERTAQNYMRVALEFGDKPEIVSLLPPTTVYALAAPSTPEPVRLDIVTRLKAGEAIASDAIIQTIRDSRAAERKAKADAKLSPEELKQRQQKERRQRKSREQREAEWAREREEGKQLMMRRAKAVQTAAQMVIGRLESDALKDLVLLLREGQGHGADDFTNFLAEAAGMDLPRMWHCHMDSKLRGEW